MLHRYLGYFCHILYTDFFQNHEFFRFIMQKDLFFLDKNISTSCIPSYKHLRTRFEAKTTEVMRSNPTHHLFFIFQFENILRSNLNFSTSYGGLTDLKS